MRSAERSQYRFTVQHCRASLGNSALLPKELSKTPKRHSFIAAVAYRAMDSQRLCVKGLRLLQTAMFTM